MDIVEVKENLCSRDPRNPLYYTIYGDDDEPVEPRKDCACDNCFYGKDKLAVELLKYMEKDKSSDDE